MGIKKSRPQKYEDEKESRGTTSFYRHLTKPASTGNGAKFLSAIYPGAVTGTPVVAYLRFSKPLRKVFSEGLPAALHHPAAL